MSIADQIAEMEVEVHSLRIQNDSLTRSNSYLTQQVSRMEGDILVLANERDTANRKASEASTLLDAMGKMAIEGITKFRSQPMTRSVVERRQNGEDHDPAPLFLESQTGGQG